MARRRLLEKDGRLRVAVGVAEAGLLLHPLPHLVLRQEVPVAALDPGLAQRPEELLPDVHLELLVKLKAIHQVDGVR